MKSKLYQLFRFLLWGILLVLLYVVSVLIYGTVTDFQPEKNLTVKPDGQSQLTVIEDSTLTFTSWNLGYGGLGAESDFFYDSGGMFFAKGKMVRSPQNLVEKYNEGILSWVKNNPADFLLFQEVEFGSKRSFYFNQYEAVSGEYSNYSSAYFVNYLVDWVPLPIFQPWKSYGATNSGLASWSKYHPSDSERLQLPGKFDWPTRIFQLDRCAAVQRFETGWGKELVVINIHNSAYDKGGQLKKAQMQFLQKLFKQEYEKGHYVIVGGDWNQCPPGFDFDSFMPGNSSGYTQTNIASDFQASEWTWAFDNTIPSNRKVRHIYKEGETFITLIDFFLISPNVDLIEVKNEDLNFAFSDHQPVQLKVRLK